MWEEIITESIPTYEFNDSSHTSYSETPFLIAVSDKISYTTEDNQVLNNFWGLRSLANTQFYFFNYSRRIFSNINNNTNYKHVQRFKNTKQNENKTRTENHQACNVAVIQTFIP